MCLLRAAVCALTALVAMAAPTPGLDARTLPLLDLAVAGAALPLWLAGRSTRSRAQLRMVGCTAMVCDVAAFAVTSVALQHTPGASTPIGLFVLIDSAIRLGWLGAGFSGAAIGAIAILVPQTLADGSRQSVGVTVLLVIAIPGLTAIVATRLRSHSDQIDAADALVRAAFDHATQGLALIGVDGRLAMGNPALERVLGRGRPPTAPLRIGEALASDVLDATSWGAGLADDLAAVSRGALIDLRAGATVAGRTVSLSAHRVGGGTGERRPVLVQVEDVTERVAAQAELEHQASHDVLTGLANRRRMTEHLTSRMRAGAPPAVVFVDLDRFKSVNDLHGHRAGDRVLMVVADRLQRAVRPDDLVGRLAGDEFLVVCAPPPPGATEPAADAAARLAARLEGVIAQPIEIGIPEGPIRVRASAGIDVPRHGDEPTTIIDRADQAMYRAKRRKRRQMASGAA